MVFYLPNTGLLSLTGCFKDLICLYSVLGTVVQASVVPGIDVLGDRVVGGLSVVVGSVAATVVVGSSEHSDSSSDLSGMKGHLFVLVIRQKYEDIPPIPNLPE